MIKIKEKKNDEKRQSPQTTRVSVHVPRMPPRYNSWPSTSKSRIQFFQVKFKRPIQLNLDMETVFQNSIIGANSIQVKRALLNYL